MISLCMIVRNEEENLPRALWSAREIVDEIVVVDTGSTDRTVEVARSLGVRVESFVWIDDFSAARNHALSLANEEWILVMDADDEFVRADAPLAKGLVERSTADAIAVRQFITQPNHDPVVKMQMAFVRNRPDLRYRFRVHEHIPLAPGRTEASELRIIHFGYTEELLPKKHERDRRLLEKMKRDPDLEARVAAGYYLGRLLREEGRVEEAMNEYKGALTGAACVFRIYCAFELAALSAAAGRRGFAASLYDSILRANPGAMEAELGLALLRLEEGNLREARRHYEAARGSSVRIYPCEPFSWEAKALQRLAEALGQPHP